MGSVEEKGKAIVKFFTIENSEGSFTINIDDISTISKYKAKDYRMYGGPNSGKIYHNPESYIIDIGSHKFSITQKSYNEILKLILQKQERIN